MLSVRYVKSHVSVLMHYCDAHKRSGILKVSCSGACI